MSEQGSPEWFAERCGKVTASRISDMVATVKGGYAASRSAYMGQLIAEILTGKVVEGYTNAAMQWGIDTEPLARTAYEARTGEIVEQVGFVVHPTIVRAGASPDGLVGTDGLVEIKCPSTHTHIDYFLANAAPPKYALQMIWQLACTGRKWVDFVSFDPRMPESMQLMIARFTPEQRMIEKAENDVRAFLIELDDKLDALRKRAGITADSSE